MNQSLLTRLFKSIDGNVDDPLVRVAMTIIEDEKKKGHLNLASRLTGILEGNLAKKSETFASPTLKVTKDLFKIPSDRRYRLPLATHVDRDELRHEMVLSNELENQISRIEKEFAAKERLAKHGLKPRQKVLLYGSSGCGKSMTAERIAWNLGLPFYRVRFDVIMSSYLGESAANLKSLFDSLQDYPCVLLLDEFDIVAKKRDSHVNDVGEIHRIVNILLGLLEEYDAPGILIATTNIEESIDSALFRRFDDIIQIPKPTNEEIVRLLKMTLSAMSITKNLQFEQFANTLEGFSSALVVKIANDAAKLAVIGNATAVCDDHLLKARQENTAFNK
jgi:SpoVK/Ycf46/Vps4 family AAA+-type ATPase